MTYFQNDSFAVLGEHAGTFGCLLNQSFDEIVILFLEIIPDIFVYNCVKSFDVCVHLITWNMEKTKEKSRFCRIYPLLFL